MAPHKDVYKCPECNKNVTKTQPSVGCACCDYYYHIECEKISFEQHSILMKNKILKFICRQCSIKPKFCNIQEELRNGFSALTELLQKDLETKFQENKRKLEEQLENGLKVIQNKIDELNNLNINSSSSNDEQLKSDLQNCFDVIKVVDNVSNERIMKLESMNSILQRRLNRADIIIRGLPKKIKNLREPIKRISSMCNICTADSDIQHCTYFAGGNAVLVKFNSVQIRDSIMINYNKNRKLLLKDVVSIEDNNNQSKIFLSDHLTDAAKKLITVCRNLKSDGKIIRYKFMNFDVPKAKITMLDQKEKMLTFEECVNLADGRHDLSDISFTSVNTSIIGDV